MSLRLLAIQFNHDPGSASTDAINLRHDATRFVHVPEWRVGISVRPTDSVAAYALSETLGRTLTIRAMFASDSPGPRTLEVRAVQPPLPRPRWLELLAAPFAPQPAQYQAVLSYYEHLWDSWAGAHSAVLGDVRARRVLIPVEGTTGFELFELQDTQLRRRGVGVEPIVWRWQCREAPGLPWSDFARSQHMIYSVLQIPKEPWLQFPYAPEATQLPWRAVLDYACRWAGGVRTVQEAQTRICRAVYNLGPSVVQYDCPGFGGTHYTLVAPFPAFDCSAFLERLRGQPGNGRYLNCIDCAAIVSTFANALGCDLWQSGMFSDDGLPFALNAIRAIGSNTWETACDWGAFEYHEVAWADACNEDSPVYDACLLVNGSPDPTRPPFFPLLPSNLRFGYSGEGHYRDRLAAPAGRARCQPQPLLTRRRRPVF